MLLYELTDAFEKAKLKYALVGGYALALHGLVRATVDADFILTLKQADSELAEIILKAIVLQPRLACECLEMFCVQLSSKPKPMEKNTSR